jgi:hypothetical protein
MIREAASNGEAATEVQGGIQGRASAAGHEQVPMRGSPGARDQCGHADGGSEGSSPVNQSRARLPPVLFEWIGAL